MKKTFTRALSLLLVLVMVLGVMPAAMAEEGSTPPALEKPVIGITVSGSASNIAVGGSVVLTANDDPAYIAAGWTPAYEWSVDGTEAEETGASFTFTAAEADAGKQVRVVLTVTYSKDGASASNNAAQNITVKAPAVPTTVTLNESTLILAPGEDATLTATVKDQYGAAISDAEVTWSSSDAAKVMVNPAGLIYAVAVTGDTPVTITATCGGKSATCSVTVEKEQAVVSVSDKTIKIGESVTITPALTGVDAADKANVTYTYTVTAGTDVVKHDTTIPLKNKFQGLITGEATIKVEAKLNEEVIAETTFKIKVGAGTLECKNGSTEYSSNAYVKLEPKYTYNAAGDSVGITNTKGITFTFEVVSQRIKSGYKVEEGTGNKANYIYATNGPAAAKVLVKAWQDSAELASCTTYVSFYKEDDIEVTMDDDITKLEFNDDDDVNTSDSLMELILDGYGDPVSNGTSGTGIYNANDRVNFSGITQTEGTLSDTNPTVKDLADVTFTAAGSGKAELTYTITAAGYDDVVLKSGELTIKYSNDGNIEYTTKSSSKVTFKEEDFAEFWKDSKAEGDLEYVTFNALEISSKEGTLYRDNSHTTSTYEVTTTDKFYYKASGSQKDLDEVTFVPKSTNNSEYDVTIPFWAYSLKSNGSVEDSAAGYVVIHVNAEGHTITSRGVVFAEDYYNSTSRTTYLEKIADDYKDETGEDLGYVAFTVPNVKQASLFYSIPKTTGYYNNYAQAKVMDQFYAFSMSKTATYSLYDLALVPAAGYTGDIEVKYTAYDEDKENKVTGSFVLTVKGRTTSNLFSDVNTTYSWAADSVDFLYYEGIAQGSNNKYNPNAKITRGDFMLMLYRAFLAKDYGTFTVTTNFSDVVKGTTTYSQETYHAVGVAKYLGIAQGTNEKFNPKSYITREEAMTLFYRTLQKMNKSLRYSSGVYASSFLDYAQISTWANSAISELVARGVIVGSNNKVSPKNNITRAEMACMLHRVITY